MEVYSLEGGMTDRAPRVVIVGGGFGGLAASKALRKTPAQIILIDHANHHLFQALLYQVATGVLTPGQIASPIRGILRNQKNTTVIMGDVIGVDKGRRCVFASNADREACRSQEKLREHFLRRRPEVESIIDEGFARIRKELNDDHKKQLDAIRENFEKHRKTSGERR